MSEQEKKAIQKKMENMLARKVDKQPMNAYREGYNYGLQVACEVAREVLEKWEWSTEQT